MIDNDKVYKTPNYTPKPKQRKTYGAKVQENNAKQLSLEDDLTEYTREMWREVSKDIQNMIVQSKHHPVYKNKDFFLELLIGIEPVLGQSRTRLFIRQSCPTPTLGRAVWKFHLVSDSLEYLWCLPKEHEYYRIMHDLPKSLEDKRNKEIVKHSCMYASGELLKLAIKLNGEKPDGVLRIKKGEDNV